MLYKKMAEARNDAYSTASIQKIIGRRSISIRRSRSISNDSIVLDDVSLTSSAAGVL